MTQSALDGFSEALSAIPPELRKTFTYDQGREKRPNRAVYFLSAFRINASGS